MTISWKDNSIMYWHDGAGFKQVTDHNRGALGVETERIGNSTRMANGALRRYTIAKKRTWSLTWEMLPARRASGAVNTVDGGMCGEDLENFYNTIDDAFDIKIRSGDGNEEIATAMITEFSKDVTKRSAYNDFWTLNITLEEV